MQDFLNKAKAVMIGHAVGDALGVPVEFRPRKYLDKNPITDMVGYGTYPVPKGAWSDDTSMSLCALESMSKGKIDYDDIMLNFGQWYYYDKFTATDETFDVGNTCSEAIHRYFKENRPYNECGLSGDYSNGNGSLMRIHPVALFLFNSHETKDCLSMADISAIEQLSALTHAHPRSQLACIIYCCVLWSLLNFNPPKKLSGRPPFTPTELVHIGLSFINAAFDHYANGWGQDFGKYYNEMRHFRRIFEGVEKLQREEIESDGYVVHTLEAALWCLLTTDNYKDCVLKAVNLGDDTDTTAAVAGGLAGTLYGYNAIPKEWRNTLLKREYIEELCEKAFKN